MPEDVRDLFDEYATRYAGGEQPEAADYLERAGPAADELAGLIDVYLQRAPVPAAPDETVAMMRAWVADEAPLVALRSSRGLKRGQVVDALIDRLGLDRGKRTKVERYYHELENGLLDPKGVDRSVWSALAETLKTRVSDLVAWRPRTLEAEPAFFRMDLQRQVMPAAAAAEAPKRVEEPDEIDRLFRGART